MSRTTLKLAPFLALAQHEVQQTLEYLARPEVRRISPERPANVLATIGNVKITVPLQFALVPSPPLPERDPDAPSDPAELLLPGVAWPPGSDQRYQLNVTTLPGCVETGCHGMTTGMVQIEFITVLKDG